MGLLFNYCLPVREFASCVTVHYFITENCVVEGRSRRSHLERHIASTVLLIRGDSVCVDGVTETVWTVDPFNCSVILDNGRTISFDDIGEEGK